MNDFINQLAFGWYPYLAVTVLIDGIDPGLLVFTGVEVIATCGVAAVIIRIGEVEPAAAFTNIFPVLRLWNRPTRPSGARSNPSRIVS